MMKEGSRIMEIRNSLACVDKPSADKLVALLGSRNYARWRRIEKQTNTDLWSLFCKCSDNYNWIVTFAEIEQLSLGKDLSTVESYVSYAVKSLEERRLFRNISNKVYDQLRDKLNDLVVNGQRSNTNEGSELGIRTDFIFLDSVPELARLLTITVIDFVRSIELLADRLEADKNLLGLSEFNFLQEISFLGSDIHNGSWGTVLLKFKFHTLVYKPQSSAVPELLQNLLNTINVGSGSNFSFFPDSIFRGNYYWQHFVESVPDHDVSSSDMTFVQNAGAFMAFSFLVLSEDYHSHNLVRVKDRLVAVDNEFMAGPVSKQQFNFGAIEDRLIRNSFLFSVCNTKLLPDVIIGKYRPINDNYGFKLLSGLLDLGTPQLIRGYEDLTNAVIRNFRSIEKELSAHFELTESRYMLRHTAEYYAILDYCLEAKNLQSPFEYFLSITEAVMNKKCVDTTDEMRFYGKEIEQLYCCYIPLFNIRAQETYNILGWTTRAERLKLQLDLYNRRECHEMQKRIILAAISSQRKASVLLSNRDGILDFKAIGVGIALAIANDYCLFLDKTFAIPGVNPKEKAQASELIKFFELAYLVESRSTFLDVVYAIRSVYELELESFLASDTQQVKLQVIIKEMNSRRQKYMGSLFLYKSEVAELVQSDTLLTGNAGIIWEMLNEYQSGNSQLNFFKIATFARKWITARLNNGGFMLDRSSYNPFWIDGYSGIASTFLRLGLSE
jgi:hypothetical protein